MTSQQRWMLLLAGFLLVLGGFLIGVAVAAPPAHPDPYCGPGMYYDYRHDVCQAFPVPPPVPIYTDPNHPDTNWGTR